MELIKDYDLEIHYHLGKANVVADALSKKSHANTLIASPLPRELHEEFEHLNLGISVHAMELVVEPTLWQEISDGQQDDEKIQEIEVLISLDKATSFRMDEQGIVWFGKWICVSNLSHLRDTIL